MYKTGGENPFIGGDDLFKNELTKNYCYKTEEEDFNRWKIKSTLYLFLQSDFNKIAEAYFDKINWNNLILYFPSPMRELSLIKKIIEINPSHVTWEMLLKNSLGWKYDPNGHYHELTIPPIANNTKYAIELIRFFKKEIDWFSVCKIMPHFTLEFIEEFKEYLIFEEKDTNFPTKVPLSSSSKINWSFEIIKKFEDYWDFALLSGNSSIIWDQVLINEFKDKICFKKISSNTGVIWNEFGNRPYTKDGFVTEAFFYEHATNEFSNKHKQDGKVWLPSGTYCELKRKLDWGLVSNNPSISDRFVFENKDKIVFSINIGKPQISWDYTIQYHKSLSTNAGMIWTDELISKFISKIDFWVISCCGNITCDLVIKYAAFFDESRFYESKFQKHSDWGHYEIFYFRNGWQNLTHNKLFTPDDNFLKFSKTRKVRTLSKIDTWDIAVEPKDGYSPKDHPNYLFEGEWVTVYEIFNNN